MRDQRLPDASDAVVDCAIVVLVICFTALYLLPPPARPLRRRMMAISLTVLSDAVKITWQIMRSPISTIRIINQLAVLFLTSSCSCVRGRVSKGERARIRAR